MCQGHSGGTLVRLGRLGSCETSGGGMGAIPVITPGKSESRSNACRPGPQNL